MDNIRILSLDGGGSRAGLLARAIGRAYGDDTPGRDIIREFALVIGNSGGAIVLTALCCGYTPREIAALYEDPDTVRRMFSPRWTTHIPLLGRWLPRYSSTGKFAALNAMFDARRQPGEPPPSTIALADWPRILGAGVQIVVTAFGYDRRRATFFRSNLSSRAASSAPAVEATLAEAVHASTNAPIIYYDRPALVRGRRYWDGVMAGYNNPVLAGVIEALANFPDAVDRMRVLSIGCGTDARPLTDDIGKPAPPLGATPPSDGLFSQIGVAAAVMTDDPPDVATFHAHMALRQPLPAPGQTSSPGMLVRLSPMLRPLRNGQAWTLPPDLTSDEFEALVDMDLDAMSRRELRLIAKMGDLWLSDRLPNQPIRAGASLGADLGFDRFGDGLAHWNRIR